MYMMIYHVRIIFMEDYSIVSIEEERLKIKVESEEHLPVMEDEIGKKTI